MGVEAFVGRVAGQRHAGALIGLALENRAHQDLQIKLLRDEKTRRGVEQFLVAGGIGFAQVIHGLHQAHAEVVRPDAVHNGAGEVWIFRRDQPLGQMRAAVGGGIHRQRLAIQRFGHLGPAGQRLHEIALSGVEHNLVAISDLGADAGEEVGHLVILVVGPLLHRVVVALGAIDRHAEEGLRGRLGHAARIVVQHEEVARPVDQRAALRGDKLAHEPVPRRVRLHLIPNPRVVAPHRGRLEPLALHEQQVGPLVGPVVHELGALQECFDQRVAFLRRFVLEKHARLVRRGQNADRVEKGAADEFAVRAGRRGR